MSKRYLILWFYILRISSLNAVQLDKRAASYVKKLVDEFKENPVSGRFDNIILPPRNGESVEDFLLPKIFIWCPIDHYRVVIMCPEHGCALKAGGFTDEVEKKSPRNPRIAYDIQGNVLIIQRHYICCHKGISHRYLSASGAIMERIPHLYSIGCFPLVMFHRSACTKELVDFLETGLLQGVNFIKICEGIAALNFNDYQRRMKCFSYASSSQTLSKTMDLNERFYTSELYSFPSNFKLTDIFLSEFQRKQTFYESEMVKCALGTSAISCDHTFKISKFVGASRGCDNTFVKQFQNLFIVLNDRREIIGWRLTRTTAFEEIRELLEHVKDIIGEPVLKLVIVDDCC